MHKTILIPTDFTIRSLGLLKIALNEQGDQKFNIILSHGVRLSTSISDLLFFSHGKLIQSLSSKEFEEGLQVIKNKYGSQINQIRIEPFVGSTQSAFHNYVMGNKIDEAYLFTGYKPALNHHDSFDITPMIEKLHNVRQVAYDGPPFEVNRQESFADLFFSRIPGLTPKS
ncbi:MAG: hypothetical protein RIC35_24205 [Marinoscillum sp.]